MSLPPQMFRSSPLMTIQHKSSTTPEVEFRIDYQKQSTHVISTSRPSQTNSGPILFFFLPTFSLLFPNWYGIHGWSATVISIHLFFSQHVTFAGIGSQTTGLSQRMECSFIAHRRPEETIDANLLMTLLWRLLKHQQRGRKHLLQGELLDCAQPGLNSSAISAGKKKMFMRLSCPEGSASFWGAITIMMISLVAHRLICWLLLTPTAQAQAQALRHQMWQRLLWQLRWSPWHCCVLVGWRCKLSSCLPHFWVQCQKGFLDSSSPRAEIA